jgi:hypothetical protein
VLTDRASPPCRASPARRPHRSRLDRLSPSPEFRRPRPRPRPRPTITYGAASRSTTDPFLPGKDRGIYSVMSPQVPSRTLSVRLDSAARGRELSTPAGDARTRRTPPGQNETTHARTDAQLPAVTFSIQGKRSGIDHRCVDTPEARVLPATATASYSLLAPPAGRPAVSAVRRRSAAARACIGAPTRAIEAAGHCARVTESETSLMHADRTPSLHSTK